MEAWHDFFVAEVGASAALAGLLVVAISINIAKIVANPALPLRAAHSLTIIATSFVIASIGLIPLAETAVHRAMAVAALLGWLASATLLTAYVRTVRGERSSGDPPVVEPDDLKLYDRFFIASTQVATISQAVGAVRILTGDDGVLGIAIGMLAAFLVAIYTSWVLLVEVLR